jgi:hypothetical protein
MRGERETSFLFFVVFVVFVVFAVFAVFVVAGFSFTVAALNAFCSSVSFVRGAP